jgi:hypothetical protein
LNNDDEGIMDDIKDQLNRIEASTKRTEQAVFGDEAIGLKGLVHDVREMQREKQVAALKAAGVGGMVAGAILGGKQLLAKWLS